MTDSRYDALLVVSFGGPEHRDEVIPFLENVLRGTRVPRERLLEVAEHYYHFDGISPINAQVRELVTALAAELRRHQIELPIYWGNRNWHPLLDDTLRRMKADGRRRALAFVTSAYGSYAGCRLYLESIDSARAALGPDAPTVDKLRLFYNHPGFIEAAAARVREALASFPVERRDAVHILYTAHSIPTSMAENCDYERQLTETGALIAQMLAQPDAGSPTDCNADRGLRWQLAYQSRSGPPQQPWLGPDIGDAIRQLAGRADVGGVVIAPIGFLSDHCEVQYDLDVEARGLCDALGLPMVRAGTVGTHPRLVSMIRELIEERLDPSRPKSTCGRFGPAPDVCPPDCCLPLANRPPRHVE